MDICGYVFSTDVELWESITTIVQNIAVLGGAIFAVFQVNAWHQEHKGKAQFEAAQNLLREALKIRAALRKARSPLILPGEYASAGHPDFNKSGNGDAAKRAVYAQRFETVIDAYKELQKLTIDAMALLTDEAETQIKPLTSLVTDLMIATSEYLETPLANGAWTPEERDRAKANRAVAMGSDGDAFDLKISAAIKSIRSYCSTWLDK